MRSQTSVKKSKTIKKALGQKFFKHLYCMHKVSINLEFYSENLKREYGFQITASFTFIVRRYVSQLSQRHKITAFVFPGRRMLGSLSQCLAHDEDEVPHSTLA